MEGCLAGVAQSGAQLLGAGAVSGSMAAKTVFKYNRGNFLYDREMRFKKELKLMNFRMEQASLWREDVRDLISLTEAKMHVYLLVNVLMLGFAVVLWCEGRLPETTPDWLMMGSALAITGSFMFLLLSIWLAMHAAISAQSYETRLVTQMVRLPIPAWAEVEACRTYASDFEQVEPRQMFRVPFVMGRQEELLPQNEAPPRSPPRSPQSPARSPPRSPARSPMRAERVQMPAEALDGAGGTEAAGAVSGGEEPPAQASDPWGLERRGDDIEELGCKHGSEVSKLRHIVITRQAMAHWQSHDAFARIAMSVGVSQLLLAMSYYILGYVLVEVGCRSAATYGVILLTVMADTIMRLDMSLKVWQLRSMQILLALGPLMSCIAAYHWSKGSYVGIRTGEACIVVSFISHSLFLFVMTRLCRIKQQDNGTMLPVAFRSVLYLDVFGWLRTPNHRLQAPQARQMSPRRRESWTQSLVPHNYLGRGHTTDILQHDVWMPLSPVATNDAEAGTAIAFAAPAEDTTEKPALHTVCYESGKPVPRRPEDTSKRGSGRVDMRDEPGALVPGYRGSAFFEPGLWLPGEEKEDDDTGDLYDFFEAEARKIEPPGLLPWRVFCTTMLILCFSWLAAGIYHILGATEVWDLDPPMLFESEESTFLADHGFPKLGNHRGFLDMLSRTNGRGMTHIIPEKVEHIALAWPFANTMPQSLSCDEEGHSFVITDGLVLLAGELNVTEASSHAEGRAKRATRLLARPRRQKQKMQAQFDEVFCPHTQGEGIEDAAVICQTATAASSVERIRCEASILFNNGRSLTTCSLKPGEAGLAKANITGIASSWLQQLRDSRTPEEVSTDSQLPSSPHVSIEKASSVIVMPACSHSASSAVRDGCTMVGTNNGRMVQLRQRSHGKELVPAEMMRNMEAADEFASTGAGKIRALNSRYMAILDRQGTMIHVFDMKNGGAAAGKMTMPQSRTASAFCSGGGHLYVLSEGPDPEMWRVALPEALAPDAADGGPPVKF